MFSIRPGTRQSSGWYSAVNRRVNFGSFQANSWSTVSIQSFALCLVYLGYAVHRKIKSFFLTLILMLMWTEHLFRNSPSHSSASLQNKISPKKSVWSQFILYGSNEITRGMFSRGCFTKVATFLKSYWKYCQYTKLCSAQFTSDM